MGSRCVGTKRWQHISAHLRGRAMTATEVSVRDIIAMLPRLGAQELVALGVSLWSELGMRRRRKAAPAIAAKKRCQHSLSPTELATGSWQKIHESEVRWYSVVLPTNLRAQAAPGSRSGVPRSHPALQWRWVPAKSAACELAQVWLSSFCRAMAALHIERVLFVGDSLTMQAAISLWKLLEQPDEAEKFGPEGRGKKYAKHGIQRTLSCPGQNASPLSFRYILNDLLRNNTNLECRDGPLCKKPDGSCPNRMDNMTARPYCWPWAREYLSSPQPTLLVLNTGLHFHSVAPHEKAVQMAIDTITQNHHLSGRDLRCDVVFFRASTPGHEHCTAHSAPFRNFTQFVPSHLYDWHLTSTFNEHVQKAIQRQRLQRMVPVINYLDTYEISTTRPDAHLGAAYRGKHPDCLHYLLPGVPDTWNALLLTHMKLIARTGARSKCARQRLRAV